MEKPKNWKEVENLSNKSYKDIIDNYEELFKERDNNFKIIWVFLALGLLAIAITGLLLI